MKKGFEVQWISHLPTDPETGDSVYDAATFKVRDFAKRNEAIRFARDIGETADGPKCAQVRQFETNRYNQRDYIGDMLEVEPTDDLAVYS